MLTDGKLKLDADTWKTIQAVQAEGNEVKWTSDEELYGVEERWTFPKEIQGRRFEDCDGITLWKMRKLIQVGIPQEVCLFTICYTETNEGHAVLCVHTDRGDFILDNRHDGVMSYDQLERLGYRFLYRMKPGGKMDTNWDAL